MKNNISQLSSKYKHVHNINKHRKQKNEWTTKIALNFSQRLGLRSSVTQDFIVSGCSEKFGV